MNKESKTISLLGETRLLTQSGELVKLEELAGNYQETAKVAFRAPHGRVKFKTIENLQPSDVIVREVIKIYLSNGHVIVATNNDHFATADGELIVASDLKVDDYLSILCYNPRTKFLSSSASKIETYIAYELPKGPQFLYDLDFADEGCLPLLSGNIDSECVSCVTYGSSALISKG